MAGYSPLKIMGFSTGLVQSREEFILPDDAYPVLANAYVWRERIKRRQGFRILGRLRRKFTNAAFGNSGASPWSFNIYAQIAPPIVGEPNAQIEPGSVIITVGTDVFTDQGNGILRRQDGDLTSTINYATGNVSLVLLVGAGTPATITFNYFPSIPVMGLRSRELNNINNEQLIAWDQVYAYKFAGGFQEFIPGTTWTGNDSDFFWTTNYWVTPAPTNAKLFWATNFSGPSGDPIRYTDSSVWIDFAPTINAAGEVLAQCQAILPFRGRLMVFNTYEGVNLATSIQFRQRIRWSAIGNPISDISALFPLAANVNPNAWRDDIRGQGGFLDIPTAENIISVGFVRDNLVIYCERSTWQLRYTGQSISPFQIEKVNSELGAESTFSAVQFDTSLVGIGDKGVVECDSFLSQRIDIKIPDLVFEFKNDNNGTNRVHGIRDIQQRLAYWTYHYNPGDGFSTVFPNRRLVYNYENDSWAIFTDSLTALGTFQNPIQRKWNDQPSFPWSEADFPWLDIPAQFPSIIGGNQQGYVEYLSSNLEPKVSNDESLAISNIIGNTTTPTVLNVINHNLQDGYVISIIDIPLGTPFSSSLNNPQIGVISGATQANPCQITSVNHRLTTGNRVKILNVVGMTELNGNTYTIIVTGANTFTLNVDSTLFTPYISGGDWTSLERNIFGVIIIDKDNFQLWKYNATTQMFSDPQLDAPATYIGGGQIKVRDGFSIVSKKFNFIDEGQNIQMGFVDVLLATTDEGAISLNVYLDFNDNAPINLIPQNQSLSTLSPDSFFNTIVPTSQSSGIASSKNFQRVYCPVRGNFITLQWTLDNAQLVGIEQESEVQIDAQILYIRKAGRQLPAGG